MEKDTAQLEVVAFGTQPLQIRWFKDGETIKYGGRFKMSSDGEHCILKISPVEQEDEGIYKCVITNKAGHRFCEAKLTVEGTIEIFGVVFVVVLGSDCVTNENSDFRNARVKPIQSKIKVFLLFAKPLKKMFVSF